MIECGPDSCVREQINFMAVLLSSQEFKKQELIKEDNFFPSPPTYRASLTLPFMAMRCVVELGASFIKDVFKVAR